MQCGHHRGSATRIWELLNGVTHEYRSSRRHRCSLGRVMHGAATKAERSSRESDTIMAVSKRRGQTGTLSADSVASDQELKKGTSSTAQRSGRGLIRRLTGGGKKRSRAQGNDAVVLMKGFLWSCADRFLPLNE